MKPTEYLRETIDLVKSIETRFLELAARLYRIKENALWNNSYDSYTDFLDAAHINPGHASILTKIHQYYVIDGKKSQKQLAGIGYSNLYESIPLIEREGVDTALAKASTLTRAEIKDEVREQKHGEHEHVAKDNNLWAFCQCGKLIKVNGT